MDPRRSFGGLVRACHPEPTAAVTGITTAFALAAGRGAGAAWVAVAALAGQLSVGWSNDFLDRHRDAAAGRRDKPIASGDIPAGLVRTAAAVALVAAVPLSLASGWRAAIAHLLGIAAAWSYNLGLKATPFSPVPFAVGFGGLPAFVILGLPGHPSPPVWTILAGALLGMGAHFANVVPDIADDLRHGVVGMPHRLGARGSILTAGALLLAASAVLALGPTDGPGVVGAIGLAAAAALLVAGLAAARRPGSRLPFRIAMTVAVLDVALLIARGQAVVA
jgi:4-hydroxybenzoate polyprenyltransferase